MTNPLRPLPNPQPGDRKCEEVRDTAGDIIRKCGDDGDKWAAAFCKIVDPHGLLAAQDTMRGWFANAIEGACSVRVHARTAELLATVRRLETKITLQGHEIDALRVMYGRELMANLTKKE